MTADERHTRDRERDEIGDGSLAAAPNIARDFVINIRKRKVCSYFYFIYFFHFLIFKYFKGLSVKEKIIENA